jgi:uncharacterized phage-associated protein
MYDINQIADYFITCSVAVEEYGEYLTNSKLQKLIYYAQGFHLGLFGKPLFEAPIEAWMHGPIVPDLYRKYNNDKDGRETLPTSGVFDISNYSQDVIKLLNKVEGVYGQYSNWRLRDFVQSEAPWKNHCNVGDSVISLESMKSYFKNYLDENGNEI